MARPGAQAGRRWAGLVVTAVAVTVGHHRRLDHYYFHNGYYK